MARLTLGSETNTESP